MNVKTMLLPILASWFLTIVGCAPALDPDRLEVNDHLRAACPYQDDSQIMIYIQGMEALRLAGYAYEDVRLVSTDSCMDADPDVNGGPAACLLCTNAVIDQVYGR